MAKGEGAMTKAQLKNLQIECSQSAAAQEIDLPEVVNWRSKNLDQQAGN